MRRLSRAVTLAFVLAASVPAAGLVAGMQSGASPRWITAWGASQHTLGNTAVSNATVRMIARVTVAGDSIRLRFDNGFGTTPLVIGSAYVGQRVQGAQVFAGSNKPILFSQAPRVTIPAGGSVVSDPVAMSVLNGQDLAVSLYIPDSSVKPSQHTLAFVTSYATADGAGDKAAEEARTAFTNTTTSMWWLKSIDVLSSAYTGTIVAFGDSITDGNCSTVDAQNRWEDWLNARLDLDTDKRGRIRKGVVNEGISGNTIGRENLKPAPDSPPALERIDRDVLSHSGVTDVIFFMGTNDIRREAPAAQVMTDMQEVTKRLKAKGLKVVGATVIPRHNNVTNSPWDANKTAIRNQINTWIRTKSPFDAFVDFDKAVQDPADHDRIRPAFNCDEIHPTPRGYYEMGRSVPLDFFRK